MDISQIRGTILFICAFLNLILALLLWFRGKSKATFHLGWVALFSAVYAFAYGGLFFFEHNKLLWGRATWLAVLIPPAYITFIYYFTERTKYLKLKSFFWYSGAIIISYLALTTPYFVPKVVPEYPCISEESFGPLQPLGRAYGTICLAINLYYLLREYFKSQGFRKLQIKYFIFGFSIYTVGGILTAGIIPLFYEVFTYIDISVLLSVFWVGLTTYAIFKKELFEIRVILTEILVGLIGLILLIQAFLAEGFGMRIFGFILFFLFCLIGYLLIKFTYREIKAKETLEQKVKERTKEIEKSHEDIKQRKEDLERFYSLTVGRELKMIELKKKIKELENGVEE